MRKLHNIIEVRFENEFIIIKVDEQIFKLKVTEVSPKLAGATDEEKKGFVISPSGYGIHWPLLDEDISINGLVNKLKS